MKYRIIEIRDGHGRVWYRIKYKYKCWLFWKTVTYFSCGIDGDADDVPLDFSTPEEAKNYIKDWHTSTRVYESFDV